MLSFRPVLQWKKTFDFPQSISCLYFLCQCPNFRHPPIGPLRKFLNLSDSAKNKILMFEGILLLFCVTLPGVMLIKKVRTVSQHPVAECWLCCCVLHVDVQRYYSECEYSCSTAAKILQISPRRSESLSQVNSSCLTSMNDAQGPVHLFQYSKVVKFPHTPESLPNWHNIPYSPHQHKARAVFNFNTVIPSRYHTVVCRI